MVSKPTEPPGLQGAALPGAALHQAAAEADDHLGKPVTRRRQVDME